MQIKPGLQDNVAEPKTNLVGLTRFELEKLLVDAGLAKFRAKQVWLFQPIFQGGSAGK